MHESAPVPAARVVALVAGSAALVVASLLLGFRMPVGAIDVALRADGARMLLALAAGMALGGAAWLRGDPAERPFRELTVFAVSTGAATGAVLLLRFGGGAVAGAIGAALGATFYASAIHLAAGAGRASNLVLAPVLLLMAGSGGVAAVFWAAEGTGQGGAVRWLLGDVAHATLLAGLAVCALVGVLLAAGRRRHVAALLFGVALGVAGPVAFVGLFAVLAVRRVLPSASAREGLWLAALVGGAGLVAADSLPRALLGGYALSLNVSLAFVAVPGFLWWNRARLRTRGRRGRLFEGSELLVLSGLTLLSALLLVVAARLVASIA